MIDLVNTRLIPVWIDVRTTPWPDVPVVADTWEPGPLSDRFLARSIVLSPDLKVFMNRDGARWVHADPPGYLQMLQDALARR